MPHPATYSLLLSPRRTMPTTCWSPCLPPWCASWARWSNWPYRSTPICRASSAHWPGGGHRHRGAAGCAGGLAPSSPLGVACQPAARQAHARRGHRQQPGVAQHGWGATPSGIRRCSTRAAGRDGSIGWAATRTHRVPGTQRALGISRHRAAGPPAHHAQPHRSDRTTDRAANGLRAGPPRVVAGTAGSDAARMSSG